MTLWVVLLTLGAASLRLFHLGLKSFWGDEAFSITLAEFRWADFRHVLASSEANMALYYLLLRIWSQISDVPWFVRLLSVLAGVATVPAIYFAGKTLFSRRAGIIAALLLALNIFHIRYSQEARSYSLVVLLVTCSSLFFVRNIKSQGRSGGVLYVLSSAAALYAHFFAALVLLAQLVSWMLLPRRLRTWAYARYLIAIAVIASPLVLFIASQGVSHLDWVSHPTTRDVYRLFIYFSGNGVIFVLFLLAIALTSREWWLQREPSHRILRRVEFRFHRLMAPASGSGHACGVALEADFLRPLSARLPAGLAASVRTGVGPDPPQSAGFGRGGGCGVCFAG